MHVFNFTTLVLCVNCTFSILYSTAVILSLVAVYIRYLWHNSVQSAEDHQLPCFVCMVYTFSALYAL